MINNKENIINKNENLAIMSLSNVEFDKSILNKWYSSFMIVDYNYILNNYINVVDNFGKELLVKEFRNWIVGIQSDDYRTFRQFEYALIYRIKRNININESYETFKYRRLYYRFLLLQQVSYIFTKANIQFGCLFFIFNNTVFNTNLFDYIYLNYDPELYHLDKIIEHNLKIDLRDKYKEFFHKKINEKDISIIINNIKTVSKVIYKKSINLPLSFLFKNKDSNNYYDKIIALSIVLEILFCRRRKSEKKTPIINEYCNKICNLKDDEKDIFKWFYSIRSNIVHNGALRYNRKDNTKINKVKKFCGIDKNNTDDYLLLVIFLYKIEEKIKEIVIFYINQISIGETIESINKKIIDNKLKKIILILLLLLVFYYILLLLYSFYIVSYKIMRLPRVFDKLKTLAMTMFVV